ncbi:hypothetical protein Poli38472_001301 [Pythium oligandrum]|uniref:Uncharacterized protein n=1 Tax=Pythium oligandrum TaxID=41045 RepID=A0A8K1CT75_PYTOL|nr:hypothetical protein Poli38472_001301 [Pythium oligandrum]|eukprot:TMW69145.1 hypothetical protein Poli38472_001301 [Pythium oligandrum]
MRFRDEEESPHVCTRFGGLEITPVMPKNDPNYQQIWRKQCEAMEIVTLFAVVDPKAWVGMLEKSIRPALLPWEFRLVEMDTAVRFFVKICEEDIDGNRPLLSLQDAKERAFGRVDTTQEEEEDAADRRWPGELVAHLLEPVKPSERSPEYLETREKILRQAGIDLGGRSSEVASIPVVLEVRLSEPHPALFPAPLADAYSRPQPAAPFVLDSVRMHYDDAGLSEDWIDDWCTYMSSKRLPLTHLELTGNGLQRRNVLPLLRRELLSDSRANPLKELTLQLPRGDFSYPGLLSLLALRSDVKTLRLQRANEIGPAVEYEEQAHRRVWRWLGFLLFSPYSNAAFHTLEVTDMDLSADNVQELNAIRETNNPFQLLHPRLNSTERSKPSRTVRVTEDIDEVVPILNVQVEEDEENEDEEADESCGLVSIGFLYRMEQPRIRLFMMMRASRQSMS